MSKEINMRVMLLCVLVCVLVRSGVAATTTTTTPAYGKEVSGDFGLAVYLFYTNLIPTPYGDLVVWFIISCLVIFVAAKAGTVPAVMFLVIVLGQFTFLLQPFGVGLLVSAVIIIGTFYAFMRLIKG